MIRDPYFIPDEDIIGVDEIGRTLILAHKGVPMLLVVARRLGYVKDEVRVGPSEVKSEDVQPARRKRKTQ